MNVTRYKPLFSISASYELTGIGVTSKGLTIDGVTVSNEKMINLRLKPQYARNVATVYYEGVENPANGPVTCEPILEIKTNEYFYFSINIAEKEKIKGLKFHSTNSTAKEIGFPTLYEAAVKVLNGPPVITSRQDVKVKLPVFSFIAKAADTGVTADYAILEIRDENNALVDLNNQPVQLTLTAVPEFAFSVDASMLKAGIYEFKVGNFTKKFFIANQIDISNTVSLVRVLKNNFLKYKKNLSDKTFVQFHLVIPKA